MKGSLFVKKIDNSIGGWCEFLAMFSLPLFIAALAFGLPTKWLKYSRM